MTGNNHRATINNAATIPTIANKIAVCLFITGTLLAIFESGTPGRGAGRQE
jgi:hypothetical protein